MKHKLTNSLLKQYNSFLFVLIGLLGFSFACTKTKEQPVEYGSPSADFIVNGVIENQASQPVPNIKIVARWDSTYTAVDGKFSLKNKVYPTDQNFLVKLSDIDGTINGNFQNKDTTIAFTNNTFTNGDGHWYSGKVEKSVVIKLTSK
jgi:putative lipoprotein (rSAM/lipoprotein system)